MYWNRNTLRSKLRNCDHVANENGKISAIVKSLIREATIFVVNIENNIRTDIFMEFLQGLELERQAHLHDEMETVANKILTAFEFY